MTNKNVWLSIIVVLSVSFSAGAAPPAEDAETVDYVLTPQPDTGRLLVELTWNTHGREQSAVLVSPHWGTVENVPKLLRELKFTGTTEVRAEGSRWLVRHPQNATIKARYEVDPGRRSLDWNGAQLPVTTRSFFHGLGNVFLLVPQSGGGLPEQYEVTLRWQLPSGWKAACSWGSGPAIGGLISPNDLRHSVYLAGKIITRTAKQDGRTVTVAMTEGFGFTSDELAELAGRIVACECTFMQEKSFPEFLVTAVPVGEAIKAGDTHLSGMGLYQSFALLAAPESRLTDAFEHLFAHELFHYWNGGVLKAKEPDKIEYWFVEGFTDYYALRIMYESGFWKPETYVKWINKHLREYHANPAMHATNEDIAARYWNERDTVGEVPYQRGLLLGLRWHRLARDKGVREGVDKLFRALIERGRGGGFELTNEAVRQTGIETLGAWFGPEYDAYVTKAETVDVPPDALAPEIAGHVAPVYEFALGFDRERSMKDKRVRGLVPGSAADKAGLRDGDELAGWKIQGDPEQKVELQVRRDGKKQTISYYPRGPQSEVLQFQVKK